MTRTENYDLIVVEGSDKVNLLTQMNPNTEKIDEQMKKNSDSGIHVATELLSGSIHAITRTVPSASMFKFTAVSNYTAGDTFTVDGIQVTALLTSGEALGTGAYIIGSEVLCSLKDTLLTVYTNGGTALLASDSEKLGGNLPDYYAKQSELTQVSSVANSASELSRENSDNIAKISTKSVLNITPLNIFELGAENYCVKISDIYTLNISGYVTVKKAVNTLIGSLNTTFKHIHRCLARTGYGLIEISVARNGDINVYSYDSDLTNAGFVSTLTFIDN